MCRVVNHGVGNMEMEAGDEKMEVGIEVGVVELVCTIHRVGVTVIDIAVDWPRAGELAGGSVEEIKQ